MKDLQAQEKRDYRNLVAIVISIIAMLVLGTLTSCESAKKVVYVPVHDTIKHTEVHYEPILLHDSVEVERVKVVYRNGDTIVIHDSINHRQIVEVPVYVHDSIIEYKSIEKPIEVEKVVEKKVYGVFWWVGFVGLLLGIAYAGYNIYKHHIKR